MIGLFKQKNPANVFFLLIMGIFIKLPLFFNRKDAIESAGDGVMYTGLVNYLRREDPSYFIFSLLATLLIFLQAVLINRYINRQRMLTKANFLPGMAYVLLTSLIPAWSYFSAPLLVNTFLIFVFFIIFESYKRSHARNAVFNAGLILGVASLFFSPVVLLIIWVMMALSIIRPFRITEWLIGILGLTVAYYFYGFYLFFNDQWDYKLLLPYLKAGLPNVQQSGWLAMALILVTVPLLSGGYLVQDTLGRMLIQVRKGWSLLLLYLFITLVLPFFVAGAGMEIWVMALVPVAAFHAATYQYSKSGWYLTILFWATLIFIFVYQYRGPGW